MRTDSRPNRLRNDLLLIGALLLIAVIAFAVFSLTMKDGKYVSVLIDGEEKYRYSLSDDIQTVITTGDGAQQANTLVIRDGKAFIESASCPDKICANHRAISKSGESIVCLPHKVVVTITDR